MKTAAQNEVVALIFERGSDEVYDRAFNWETAVSMVLEGYAAVAVSGDGHLSQEQFQQALEADMLAYEDNWGVDYWRPSVTCVPRRTRPPSTRHEEGDMCTGAPRQ